MNKYNILAIFSNHTYNNIKYNISFNNISYIIPHVNDIIIVDSIEEEYDLDKPFSKKLVTQIWNCYFNLKDLPKLDFHNYNLGYNIDGELVLFDATPIKSRVNRFDEPNII